MSGPDTRADESRRLLLTVAYDGRPFEGWQSQVGGNTVQDVLLETLRTVSPDIKTVQGSGRTDAGVHALAQTAHFDASPGVALTCPQWIRALNARLPKTIRIFSCREVAPDFHARFSARTKTYRYRLHLGEVLPPLESGLAWHLPRGLDHERLRKALDLYAGQHNFRAFAANRGNEKASAEPPNTVRTLSRPVLSAPEEQILTLEFTGDGFLYKMVRFLVGTAVRCAQSKLEVAEVERLLHQPVAGEKAPYCAPPDGLYLVNVNYDFA